MYNDKYLKPKTMKLNLEVELDFINDEMSVNETIKQNIIDAVVGKIQGNVEYANRCKIENVVIIKQNEIIQQYKSQSIMVNDYIKKGEVKVLRPKR